MARTQLAAGAARRLLSRFDISEPPVDLERITNGLGVHLVPEEFPDDISGVLVRSPERSAIAFNATHHPNRQRFTIAHELGHFMLHPDLEGYYDKSAQIGVHYRAANTSKKWDSKEIEANRFAAELLMPRRMIVRAIEQMGTPEASSLARLFGVSEEAMTYRLADIRI